ncbi:MAG TPA: large conductance mechanosensitive channel protein MscL [Ktedonobacterales bacterium]|jgi:large conductance mechanosensitive channel
MKAVNDFKAFILRGSVVDLAVGIVIGAAFTAVVTGFVSDLLMPLIGIPGKFDLSSWTWTVNGSVFHPGLFVNVLIAFLIVAAVIFFLVVQPVNALMARRKTSLPADPTTRDCPYCLSTIPLKATRCPFCTSEVAPVAVEASAGGAA